LERDLEGPTDLVEAGYKKLAEAVLVAEDDLERNRRIPQTGSDTSKREADQTSKPEPYTVLV
jgi:hypothetical protein